MTVGFRRREEGRKGVNVYGGGTEAVNKRDEGLGLVLRV